MLTAVKSNWPLQAVTERVAKGLQDVLAGSTHGYGLHGKMSLAVQHFAQQQIQKHNTRHSIGTIKTDETCFCKLAVVHQRKAGRSESSPALFQEASETTHGELKTCFGRTTNGLAFRLACCLAAT